MILSSTTTPWKLQPSELVCSRRRHHRADKAVVKNYRKFVGDLGRSENPASMRVPKKGRYGGCLGAHITKSVVLVYRINYTTHSIDLVNMGDHKMVYGSDG